MNNLAMLSLLKGFQTYVIDGNVVELRPCGFINELNEAVQQLQAAEDTSQYVVDLSNGGSIEIDPEDGVIRYHDYDGNCEDKWAPGDESYDRYLSDYFPDFELESSEEDEEVDE